MRFAILISLSLLVCLSSCQGGVSADQLQDMQGQLISLERMVDADQEFLRETGDYHRRWMYEHTDSAHSPLAAVRYASDSVYQVAVGRQSRIFQDWFSRVHFLNLSMRLRINAMNSWLIRLRDRGGARVTAHRSFASELETYLGDSRAYRLASANYQSVKAGYTTAGFLP